MYSATDTSPVVVTGTVPSAGATSVATNAQVSAAFSKPVLSDSITMQVLDPSGTALPGTISYNAATPTATFNPAQGFANATTYTATVKAGGMAAPVQWTFTTATADGDPNVCPCTLFNDSDQPTTGPDRETVRVQLGMAFTVSSAGQITGVRYYKNPDNQGPHPVALWNSSGTKLAEATTPNETASGWQQATFDTPVSVTSGTTYTVSYTAPQGRYSSAGGGLSAKITKGPLSSVATGGRYSYGTGSLTSTSTANYFVDPVFTPAPASAPALRSISPGNQATSVAVTKHIQATFSTDIQPGSATITVKQTLGGAEVPSQTSGESQGAVATFVPTVDLDPGTSYTVSVSGARNLSGTPMTTTSTSTFTTSGATACPCSLMDTSTEPVQVDSNDGAAVTLGLKFTPSVSGFIKGLRYYRDASNTGTHTGALYTSAGVKLADLTFSTGGTGWQSANFATAVAVTAGTTYVAAYYAPDGHYSADLNFFAQPVVNKPLASVNPGSVYLYGDGFPTQTYMNTNYYVDVLFVTSDDDPPSVTTIVPAASATSVSVDTAVTRHVQPRHQPHLLGDDRHRSSRAAGRRTAGLRLGRTASDVHDRGGPGRRDDLLRQRRRQQRLGCGHDRTENVDLHHHRRRACCGGHHHAHRRCGGPAGQHQADGDIQQGHHRFHPGDDLEVSGWCHGCWQHHLRRNDAYGDLHPDSRPRQLHGIHRHSDRGQCVRRADAEPEELVVHDR